ncbi:MAG: glycosyltransferase family 4 protein [Thermodesulfobacteriota bacterium]|nr:MAG: glycosyltransferase family 4 protein [Thermodesulfobacteriota bacterium]
MRVLFITRPLGIGGHINSTLSIIREFERRGHETFLLATEGLMGQQFRDLGTTVFILKNKNSSKTIGKKIRYFRQLIKIIKQNAIDIVQAQDQLSLYPAYFASAIMEKPLFFTKAGGEVPKYVIPEEVSVVVFSKELEQGMKSNGYKNQIFFIPGRIDCGTYYAKMPERSFLEKYHLPLEGIKVVMAMRFDPQKKPWLESFLHNLHNFDPKKAPKQVSVVLVGDGPLFPNILKTAEKINESLPMKVLYLTGKISQANEMMALYNYADIVVGHGRGILEAMACGKPVINLGENGLGTVVDEGSITQISYYNFSGRHLRHHPAMGKELLDSIVRIAGNSTLMKNLGDFSLAYIRRNYDARTGAEAFLKIYSDKEKQKKPSFRTMVAFTWKRFAFALNNRLKAISHGK